MQHPGKWTCRSLVHNHSCLRKKTSIFDLIFKAMTESTARHSDFLSKATEIIEENISNEQFGVSELAEEMGMSRSNLLRKIKKITGVSVSQFIRQIRLKKAMDMLRQTSLNVSEISFSVGFSSVSYFIRCFRDYYGFPPGEAGQKDTREEPVRPTVRHKKKGKVVIYYVAAIVILVSVGVWMVFLKPSSSGSIDLEKSIAVLPFKNNSSDSTNIHIINGLMESTLNNLQKMEDLRVISRTSVEKYRTAGKTIPEIAGELNVSYLIEGSGQKIGDQILLHIQLIEAPLDKHIWSERYRRKATDIFDLQQEVAKNIAEQIQVIITPEEEERIAKIPTNDLVAYDYFLKGMDLFYKGTREGLEEAIPYLQKAVEHDNEFARAYAVIAISYYYLDVLQAEKRYSELINNYADKALLYDSKLPQSLIAKALFYMNNREYDLAVPHLEKALEYNPNSALVINILSDFYVNHVPNIEKYLEYALKGITLDIASHDSSAASFIYLHVSNALVQTGFVDEAEEYVNKSLSYDPQNLFSEYLKAFIQLAKHRDLGRTKELLIEALQKDTTRLDIMQEVAKVCYYLQDYRASYEYYRRFMEVKEAQNLDIYRGEDAKIAVVLAELGLTNRSDSLFQRFKEYAESDQSVYKHLSLAAYYSYKGDPKRSLEHLRLYSRENHHNFWIVLFLEIEPLFFNIKDLPEFRSILNEMEVKFWNYHNELKVLFEKKELI